MFASPSDQGDDGSPPLSLCKDKGVMRVALRDGNFYPCPIDPLRPAPFGKGMGIG